MGKNFAGGMSTHLSLRGRFRRPVQRVLESLTWGKMSVQAMSFVIDNSKHKGSYLLTLLMIANHAHADGTGAYPSVPTLAKETRMSERGVRYCLQVLKDSGELEVFRDAGPRGCNLYQIPMRQSLPEAKNGIRQTEAPNSTPLRQDPTLLAAIAIAPEPSLTVLKENHPYVFPIFWEAYPNKKGGELAAKSAWVKILGEHHASEILFSLQKWKQADWKNSEYVPYAEKWLLKRQWKNAPEQKGGIDNEQLERVRASRR